MLFGTYQQSSICRLHFHPLWFICVGEWDVYIPYTDISISISKMCIRYIPYYNLIFVTAGHNTSFGYLIYDLGIVSLAFVELSKISRENTQCRIWYFSCELQAETVYLCPQYSMVLGTRTKHQLEFLIRSMMIAIHKFRENILESSQNIKKTPPGLWNSEKNTQQSSNTSYKMNLWYSHHVSIQSTLHITWTKAPPTMLGSVTI